MRAMRTPMFPLVLVLSLAACGGAPTPPPATPPATPTAAATLPAGVKKPGDAQMGDKTVCPVSGEEFTVTASSPKVDYKGKTIYFCCGGCEGKFQANPDEYMKKYEGT
jgi:YHS domain-containing protein